jgi:hypothetical protein
VQEFHLLAFVFIFESEVDLFEPDALRNHSDAPLPPHVSAALVIWGDFAGLWGDVPRMPRLNPLQFERPCMSLCTPMHMHMHNDARLLHITPPACLVLQESNLYEGRWPHKTWGAIWQPFRLPR